MESIEIQFDLYSTDVNVPLGFCAKINDKIIIDTNHVIEPQTVKTTQYLETGEHDLKLSLFNKSIEHTTLDKNNNITHDARLVVKNLYINQQQLDQVLYENSTYYHDFNGNANQIQDRFYGQLGCNGTVELKFKVPSYIWFLEVC